MSTLKGVPVVHPLEVSVVYDIPQIVRHRIKTFTRNSRTSYVADIEYPQSFPHVYYVYDRVLPVKLLFTVVYPHVDGLIKATKAHRRMQAKMQYQHSQPDSSMTFSLVIVVIVFIICRVPLLTVVVMWLLKRWSPVVRGAL